MNIFTLLTPITYWLLVALWLFVLIFYIRRLFSKKIISPLTRLLIVILAIDAFRTLFESCYFGAWYTSLAGLIPREVHNVLVRPELVIIPKLTNLLAVAVVVFILLRRWLPQEEHEKEQLNALIQEQISQLTNINNKLQIENFERRRVEEALNRLNRELRAISDCNQALVRAEDEQTLLDEICRIICDEAGYRMAWVGYAENDEAKTIRPVSWAGVEDGYLAEGHFTWADTERGRGPCGIAIREGHSACIQDFATDLHAAPWRERALQRGYRSVISLPLHNENDEIFGTIGIYSTEPNAFTPDEIRLMEELAGDLAFGIQALRNRINIKRAEEALHLQTVGLEAEVTERQAAQENLQEQALILENEIEEHRQAQDELEALNESLEERVNERTAELERANTRLQELDRMKSMFIASMSHELRTPLNSVIGFSRILLNEWLGPLNGEQKENLATVLRSGSHLLSLVNDVIDVSKIEAGLIEAVPEEVDVHDVVSEAVTSCENAALDKGIDLKVQAIHHTMHTDRTRLLQCLLNLISNAVKYTEKGTITVCAEVPDGGVMLELSVADTGIGIREDDLGKLFSPFVRLNSPLTSTVPGTGLGLYLTKKLVTEVLQGDITVSSAAGVGSTFVLTVPVSLQH